MGGNGKDRGRGRAFGAPPCVTMEERNCLLHHFPFCHFSFSFFACPYLSLLFPSLTRVLSSSSFDPTPAIKSFLAVHTCRGIVVKEAE